MSKDRKDKEMICGLTADEHEVLRRELNALPETMPPRAVWQRIQAQAEAEGLIGQRPMRRPITWQGGLALAATVLLAAVLVPMMTNAPQTEFPTQPTNVGVTTDTPVNVLQALMVESRQLESDLRALPVQPRVMLADTAATISDIEDRIAAIDFQLNDPAVDMSAEDKEIFWRERVRLMRLLVRLRYAQAQRTAF
jgi:hypothetical protein